MYFYEVFYCVGLVMKGKRSGMYCGWKLVISKKDKEVVRVFLVENFVIWFIILKYLEF